MAPEKGMLKGVTRCTIIQMAQSLGLEVPIGSLSASELRGLDEVSTSTSGGGALPSTVLDESDVSDGDPGPITRK